MPLRQALSALLTALLLTGCGGGSGNSAAVEASTSKPPDSPPATEAVEFEADGHDGIWRGVTETNRSVTAFVFSNGAESVYWLLYSQPNDARIDGLVQGAGTIDGRSMTADRSNDYNFTTQELRTGRARAVLNDAGALEWQYLSTSAVAKLSASDYTSLKGTPLLATIAGTYTGELVQRSVRKTATIVITGGGLITATSDSGCRGFGSVNPDDTGRNVFWISIEFRQSCNVGPTLGLAYWDPKSAQLYLATQSDIDGGTPGAVFVGTK
jgi:hypothetical protein